MPEILLTPLEKAVAQLTAGLQAMQTDPGNDLARDGVIQRFEYTMDLSWKILFRILKERFQVDTFALRAKKDIFREAARLELIADAEHWFAHYEARNLTSHDYNQDKADTVFNCAKIFLPDVQALIENLKHVD